MAIGLYPAVTLVCIILTANHYWIDGVGGLICLGVGYAAARAATGRRPTGKVAPVAA